MVILREDDPRFRITPVQQMASACTGALITSLFMTPLDVVKIRLQAQQKAMLSNKCYLYCNGLMEHLCPCGSETGWIPRRVHFNGTMDAFYKISKSEGVTALWSGLSPTLVLALPSTVVYFVTYEQLRSRFKDEYTRITQKDYQPMWIPMLAGASARVIAVTMVSPLELIRTTMQSQKLSYADVFIAIREVLRDKGFAGLFRGLGSTLLRDVPFSAIYWTTFETVKNINGRRGTEDNNFAFNFLAGACGGCLAAFITLPFDVIKTHQQIELGEKEIYNARGLPKQRALNMKQIANNIYKIHGIRGLFAGLLPRIFKVAPACAIMIATFEYGKQFFRTYNSQMYKEKLGRSQDYVIHGNTTPT